jgi:hypothetical protein
MKQKILESFLKSNLLYRRLTNIIYSRSSGIVGKITDNGSPSLSSPYKSFGQALLATYPKNVNLSVFLCSLSSGS